MHIWESYTMMVEKANGTKGHLLYVHGADKYVFRVYGENGKFIDYDLRHNDLCVIITDEDAAFYVSEDGATLDHSPLD